MINRSLLLMLFILAAQFVSAQTDSFQGIKKGEVAIFRDVRLDTLVQRIYVENEDLPQINGYRIQIYSGSKRTIANQVKAAFMVEYREERAYLSYIQPYFKVRVGNFRSKAEAIKLYESLRENEKFKAVLIVVDKIDLPELLEYPLDKIKD